MARYGTMSEGDRPGAGGNARTIKLVVALLSVALVTLVLSGSSLMRVSLEGSGDHPKETLWGAGDAKETRPLKSGDITMVGDIPADETVDNGLFDSPLVDVAHAACSKETLGGKNIADKGEKDDLR